MRIGLDATPLLGARTGVGRYALSLLTALTAYDDQLVATAFTFRGRDQLRPPPGVRVAARPAPARALQELWARGEWPPVELLSGNVDVFHATNFVLPPLRRARGVVTIHDLSYLHQPETVSTASARYRALVPRSLERAAAVVTPSATTAELVRAEYDVQVPVVVTPLGVDPGWFDAAPPDDALRTELGLPSTYLVFVGTLEPRKDLRTLVDAHRLMVDAPPLVLVGPPGWGEQVDVRGCITTGYLEDERLRAVVAGAAALVLPSRDEGFGIPVLEALAAGTPVVASDLPVLREVGGTVTTYAEPGGPASFAAALEQVLDEPGDRQLRRAHASAFTWGRCAERTREAYLLALG
ncbi:MAG: glycosyltransferase family 4 protein [Actinobacteria bacterium]|nr:glycosyltransferase family 4 protein [Actinomycetota bacterium]MCA1719946.1 glycosyltransferase family 4 protein [Actinomycetota bacterium]